MPPSQAWKTVESWLDVPTVWIPTPGDNHNQILGELIVDGELRGNLIGDAILVAICIEYGLEIISADVDFARFENVKWVNPIK